MWNVHVNIYVCIGVCLVYAIHELMCKHMSICILYVYVYMYSMCVCKCLYVYAMYLPMCAHMSMSMSAYCAYVRKISSYFQNCNFSGN